MKRIITILFLFISTVSFAQIGIINYDTIQSKKMETDTMNIRDYLLLDTAKTVTDTEPVGASFWDEENLTISDVLKNGVVYQRGTEQFILVKNSIGTTIEDGTPVIYAGLVGSSGNIRIEPASTAAPFENQLYIGWATHDMGNGENGLVTTAGKVRGIQTNGADYGETWSEGDDIYMNCTTGDLTNVVPEAPDSWVLVGIIVNVHSTTGTIETRRQLSTKIDDAADVNGTALTESGQFPVWNQDSSYFDFDFNINDYLSIESFTDSIPTIKLTRFDSTDFRVTIPQVVDLQNSLDVIESGIPAIATITEAQAGKDNTKMMTPLRVAEQIELNAVSYYDVREDIYSDHNITADTVTANYFDGANQYFEKELTEAENNINVGFTLDTDCLVSFNGQPLPQAVWSGEGTTTINLSLETKKYDLLIIKK